MTARKDVVSPAAAGCVLLTFGVQPTDRALAGWDPWGDVPAMYHTEHSGLPWLASLVTMCWDEQLDTYQALTGVPFNSATR